MLYLIGLGLSDEKDISVRGLEIARKCDMLYLENYSSALIGCPIEKLEKYYGKKIQVAERELVEQSDEIVKNAQDKNVALLVIGDSMAATTHLDIMMRAREKNVSVRVIHNASILTAVGLTGLQLYKFGKTVTIPYPEINFRPEIYYHVLKQNKILGLHTLLLLDLKPAEKRFMKIREAIDLLWEIEDRQKEMVFIKETMCIACARLGSDTQKMVYGKAGVVREIDMGIHPYCLVVPGELHFMEEEAIGLYAVSEDKLPSSQESSS